LARTDKYSHDAQEGAAAVAAEVVANAVAKGVRQSLGDVAPETETTANGAAPAAETTTASPVAVAAATVSSPAPAAAPANPTSPAAATSPTSEVKGKKKSFMAKLFQKNSKPETFKVHISHPNGEPLGMKIRSDEDAFSGVMISEVHPDRLAAKSGKIAVGQYLHQINGVSTASMTHDDVVRALAAPELDLLLSIHPFENAAAAASATVGSATAILNQSATQASDAAATAVGAAATAADSAVADATAAFSPITNSRRVTLQKADGEPVGLKLVGDHGATISEISKDSPAGKAGLKIGDKVIGVNDADLSNSSASDIVAAIKSSGNSIVLNVAAPLKKKNSKLGGFFSSKKKTSENLAAQAAVAASPAAAAPASAPAPAAVDAPSAAAAATTTTGDAAAESSTQVLDANDPQAVAQAAAEALIRKVTLSRGSTGLGMKIKSDDLSEFVFVSEIVPGGAAAQSGQLSVGDHLVQINDTSMRHAIHESVVMALQQSTVVLHVVPQSDLVTYMQHLHTASLPPQNRRSFSSLFKRNKSESGSTSSASAAAAAIRARKADGTGSAASTPSRSGTENAFAASLSPSAATDAAAAAVSSAVAPIATAVAVPAASEVRHVTLTRSAEGLGMKIKSDDPMNGVCVYELTPGGVAASSGAISVGDVIVQVNGKPVMNMNHEDVVRELTSQQNVTLGLTTAFPQTESVNKRTVVIKSDGQPFGLTLADASPGVRVEGVDEKSPATGLVKLGDYILAVDSHPTLTSSAADVASLLLLNPQPELVVSEQWPAAEYAAQYRLEDIHIQAQEGVVRAVAQHEADAAMSLEQAQRVTTEKMHEVQDALVRQHSRVEASKAEAEEQARRVAEDAIPSADVLEQHTIVQEQLVHRASAIAVAEAEKEEQTRRVTENQMHDVQDQLLSTLDRKKAAALEHEEQVRREAEASVVSSAAAAAKHAVEAELVAKQASDNAESAVAAAQKDAQDQVAAAQKDAQDKVAAAQKDAQDKAAAVQKDAQAQVAAAQTAVAAAQDKVVAAQKDAQAQVAAAQKDAQDKAAASQAEAQAAVAAAQANAVAAQTAAASALLGAQASLAEAGSTRKVTVNKGSGPLGLKLTGSKGVRISEVTPGSAAEQAGGLHVGDLITGVDGSVFDEKSPYDDVLAALKAAGPQVVLTVSDSAKVTKRRSFLGLFGKKDKKDKEDKEDKEEARAKSGSVSAGAAPASNVRTVVLKREPGAGLGMQLQMDSVGDIFEVVSDSPAAKAGVKANERILQVNGVSLEGKTVEDLVAALKQPGDVTLVLQNAPGVVRSNSRGIKGFFGLGKSSDKSSAANPSSPATGNLSAIPEPAAVSAVAVAAPVAAAAAPAAAVAAPGPASSGAEESELQKEVAQLRYRLADAEMGRAAGEKRIQALTTELNDALAEIARLRGANSEFSL
jgi:C-terminal processing protease CtpA/Prc